MFWSKFNFNHLIKIDTKALTLIWQRTLCQSKSKSTSIASSHSVKQPSTASVKDSDHEWKAIYRSNIIVPAVILCRMKIYQTIFSLSLSSYLTYLYMMDQVEQKVLVIGASASAFAVVMLFVAGNVFKKMIGFAYLNQDETLVKLAHVTFWGHRQENIYELKNIMPLSDSNQIDIAKAMFAKIKFYDNQDEYFINLRFGGIIDKDKFAETFGFYC